MVLSELRVMSGPNMWSDIHKVIAIKVANLDGEHNIHNLLNWIKKNELDFTYDQEEVGNFSAFISTLVSELIKFLQPDSQHFFTDAICLGTNSWYALAQYGDKDAGIEAAYTACEIIDALLENKKTIAFENARAEIKDIYDSKFLGPSTSTIVNAALKRNIPVRRSPGGFIVFGQGAFQKRIAASISENTSDISVDIAGDKDTTKRILEEALIPVPRGYLIRKPESIQQIIPKLEFPVVVKPLNANQGKGITSNIQNEETLKRAFHHAKTFSNAVIIEKQITGNDYRFLVIGYKVVAVAHRTPASVTGDGQSTIRQLIDQVNADPQRGDGHGKVLSKIIIDDLTRNLLKSAHKTLDSVPDNGQTIVLKDTANLSTGGTATDVTDEVHPDNIILAERVAAHIGLDICGIDIMAPDIKTPIVDNGGAVLEVNAAPGLRMHVSPSQGKARNIGDPIVDLMYPRGSRARLPIIAITGTNGKTTTTRLMAHITQAQGYKTGFTTTDGIYLNTTRIFKGDCTGSQSAKLILQEPSVEFAVLECARGGIIRSGLAFDECDIGIVTNVAADHIGLKDIYSVEDLAKVKSVIPKSVKQSGYAILNASDDLVYEMRKNLKCRIALFSIDSQNPRILQHCNEGGIAAVMTTNRNLVILIGSELIHVENVHHIPLSMDGKADFMIENILPVILASYLLKFDLEITRRALTTFIPSPEQTPGRLNKFMIQDINVILDYAHNPHGLKALGKYLANIHREVTGIITAVGDRRDEDIIEVGKVAADMYDKIIIRFDKDRRGRSEEQIAGLIIKGLISVNPKLPYTIISDIENALIYALENSAKGDYVVMSADDSMDTIAMVKRLSNEFIPKTVS